MSSGLSTLPNEPVARWTNDGKCLVSDPSIVVTGRVSKAILQDVSNLQRCPHYVRCISYGEPPIRHTHWSRKQEHPILVINEQIAYVSAILLLRLCPSPLRMDPRLENVLLVPEIYCVTGSVTYLR